MSNVKDGDIFMVSRDGTEFQVKNEDTSNLRDDDLFWVQRDGVNYSVTADQVNTGGGAAAPELNSVILTQTTTGDRFTNQSFLSTPTYTTSGSPPATIGLKGEVTGALSIAGATDEIVGITSNDYSSMCTGVGYDVYTINNVFDGDESTGCFADTGTTITFTPTTEITGTFEILVAQVSGSGQLFVNGAPQGITGAYPDTTWQTIGISPITSVSWDRNTFVAAMRVDDQLLITGNTLTLASDANLTNGAFKAGDVVKQNNSPLVATSSTITNVNEAFTPIQGFNYAFSGRSDGPEAYFDREVHINADTIGAGSFIIFSAGSKEAEITMQPGQSGGTVYGSNDLINWPENWSWSSSTPLTKKGYLYYAPDSSVTAYGGITFTGNGTSDTILTLKNSNGLSDFEVGDKAQALINKGPWTEGFRTAPYNEQQIFNNATPVTVNSGESFSGASSTDCLCFDRHALGDTGSLTFTRTASSWEFYIKEGDDPNEAMARVDQTRYASSFTVSRDSSDLGLTGRYLNLLSTGSTTGFTYTVVGTALSEESVITAIDENVPSITTDGGSWSGTDGSGDTAYDQNNWSTLTQVNGTTNTLPIENAFDGDVTKGCQVTGDGSAGFTLIIPSGYSNVKLETNCFEGGAYPVNTLVNSEQRGVNNGSFIDCGTVSSGDLVVISRTFPGGGATTLSGIKLNDKLLVDTGTTGGPESFVTGPSKPVTATLVSVDPSVPSMEVIDVVGPWSANTGNYAVNTVVHPVMIKPETSPLTGTTSNVGNVIVSGLTDVKNANLMQGLKNSGDPLSIDVNYLGVVSDKRNYPNYTSETATATFLFNPPVPTIDTVNVYGGSFNDAATQVDKTVIYSDGTQETLYENSGPNKWYWETAFSTGGKSIASVTIYSANHVTAGGITLGDNNFITSSGNLTLNFTDDTNLNQFEAGDDVYANQAYTPTTSAITVVGNEELSRIWSVYLSTPSSTFYFDYPASYAFNGINNAACPGVSGESIIWTPPAISGNLEIAVTSPQQTWTLQLPGGQPKAFVPVGGFPDYSDLGYVEFDGTNSLVLTASTWSYLAGVKINGQLLLDDQPYIRSSLAFTDNKDLDKFEVGDQITSPSTSSDYLFNRSSGPAATIDNSGKIVTFNNSAGNYGTATTTQPLKGKVYWECTISAADSFYIGMMPTDMELYEGGSAAIGYVYPPSIAYYAVGGYFQVAGSTLVVNIGSYPTNPASNNGLVRFAYDSETGKFFAGTTDGWWNDSDPELGTNPIAVLDSSIDWSVAISGYSTASVPFDFKPPMSRTPEGFSEPAAYATGTIAAKGASNFTVDGSSDWVVGEVVKGQPIPPATGTVGSIENNTMTLSTSDGRWVPGTKVTTDEKPALASTVALNFDANGVVSGLAAITPDYVNMNSTVPLLNFPSTFSDGKTPDETIPEGSYIQTEVRAWNAIGESIKKSNKVTPGTTTRLSKGETRLIDGYTPVATAAARQTLAEAQKIEDDITKATDNLKLAISKYEEQGKRRSV